MVSNQSRFADVLSFSTVDYPHHFSAVLYTQGCPLRCPWCHNEELHQFDQTPKNNIPWKDLEVFLKNRVGLLDAIVISGGEPLYQPKLLENIQMIKNYGFKVGLHTSGVLPKALNKLITHLDWVGLDVKTLPHKYDSLISMRDAWESVEASLELLVRHQIPLEVRTSTGPEFMSMNELIELMSLMENRGVSNFVFQELNPTKSHPQGFLKYTQKEKERLQNVWKSLFVDNLQPLRMA